MYVTATATNANTPSRGKSIWCSDEQPSIWCTKDSATHSSGIQLAGTCHSVEAGGIEIQRTFEVFLSAPDLEKILAFVLEERLISISVLMNNDDEASLRGGNL